MLCIVRLDTIGGVLFDGDNQLPKATKDVVQAANLVLDTETLNSRS